MAISADIIVRIAANASDAAAEVDRASGKFEKFKATMGSLVAPATIALGAIAAFGKQAVDAASATEQAMGAVDSVFGDSAATVKGWADGAAQAVGLSKSAYGQLASVAGASLKSMGMDTATAADQTGKLITLGADLAATFGGTTAEAVDALTAALRGEADPAERLGLKLNQTTVAARMAADGTDKLTGSAYDAAKAATIMTLATEQAAGANGQFARESDTAAGSAQIAAAQWENAKSALGESLLPVVAAATEKFAEFATWLGENKELVLTLAGVVGGLAAAVLAVNAALAVASAAQAVWNGLVMVGKGIQAAATAAQWAWNAAMAANPLGLVILAIAAVIAGIVLLWNNCDAFRDFFIGVWEAVSDAAVKAWNWIKDTAGAVWDWIVGKVTDAAEGIKAAVGFVTDWIVDKWNSVKDAAAAVWEAIKSGAEAAWNGVKSVVDTVMNAIRSIVDGALSFIIGLWDKLKSAGESCWNAIKRAIDFLMAPINAVKNAIQWLIDKLKQAWEWAQKVISKIPFVGGMLSSSSAAAAPVSAARSASLAVAPSARSSPGLGARVVRRGALAGGAGGVVVNVSGALDPVAVADQIEGILTRQRRRLYGVTV